MINYNVTVMVSSRKGWHCPTYELIIANCKKEIDNLSFQRDRKRTIPCKMTPKKNEGYIQKEWMKSRSIKEQMKCKRRQRERFRSS